MTTQVDIGHDAFTVRVTPDDLKVYESQAVQAYNTPLRRLTIGKALGLFWEGACSDAFEGNPNAVTIEGLPVVELEDANSKTAYDRLQMLGNEFLVDKLKSIGRVTVTNLEGNDEDAVEGFTILSDAQLLAEREKELGE